jgi:hypothetical protein
MFHLESISEDQSLHSYIDDQSVGGGNKSLRG